MSVSPAKRASFIPSRCSVEGKSKSTQGVASTGSPGLLGTTIKWASTARRFIQSLGSANSLAIFAAAGRTSAAKVVCFTRPDPRGLFRSSASRKTSRRSPRVEERSRRRGSLRVNAPSLRGRQLGFPWRALHDAPVFTGFDADQWSVVLRRLAERLPPNSQRRVSLIGGVALALAYGPRVGRRRTPT